MMPDDYSKFGTIFPGWLHYCRHHYLFNFGELNLFQPLGERICAESFLKCGEGKGLIAMDQTFQFCLAVSNRDGRCSLDAFLAIVVTLRTENTKENIVM